MVRKYKSDNWQIDKLLQKKFNLQPTNKVNEWLLYGFDENNKLYKIFTAKNFSEAVKLAEGIIKDFEVQKV